MSCAAILAATERMLAAAATADWDQVAQANTDRDRLLRDIDPGELAPLLPQLAEDTERLLRIARRARDASRDALSQLRHGRRATDAYAASGCASR